MNTIPLPNIMKLAIATPFYCCNTWSQYVTSLATSIVCLCHKGIQFDFWELPNDPYLWRARNIIANRFIESDCTDLILIDSDMAWPPQSFMKLVETDVPVCGTAYPAKCAWEKWTSIPIYGEDHKVEINENGLIPAFSLAFGFAKIRKSVFVNLIASKNEKWNAEGNVKYDFFSHIKSGDRIMGEDISFCHRLNEIGEKMWLLPDCKLTHYGYDGREGNFIDFLKNKDLLK